MISLCEISFPWHRSNIWLWTSAFLSLPPPRLYFSLFTFLCQYFNTMMSVTNLHHCQTAPWPWVSHSTSVSHSKLLALHSCSRDRYYNAVLNESKHVRQFYTGSNNIAAGYCCGIFSFKALFHLWKSCLTMCWHPGEGIINLLSSGENMKLVH
jgi:hypothetical protein